MIVTVTLNAALDRTLTVPNFQRGQRHRASGGLTIAGGKGINVARALKRLDVPVVATGLAGGLTGTRLVEELTGEAILNDFVRIADESRTSTAVVDPTSSSYTEINEWGPHVEPEELDMFREKLRYLARAADVVVFAGSLPRGVEDELLRRPHPRAEQAEHPDRARCGRRAAADGSRGRAVPRLAEPARSGEPRRPGVPRGPGLHPGARRHRRARRAQRADHPGVGLLRAAPRGAGGEAAAGCRAGGRPRVDGRLRRRAPVGLPRGAGRRASRSTRRSGRPSGPARRRRSRSARADSTHARRAGWRVASR